MVFSFLGEFFSSCLAPASAAAHLLLVSLVPLPVPGVLPVSRHGPVGGATPLPHWRPAARSAPLSPATVSGPAAIPLLSPVAHLHFNSKRLMLY